MSSFSKIICTLLLGTLFSCQNQPQSEESEQVVLFVCTHGAARSPIAAAYFNRAVEEKGLNYKAIFRATEPDSILTRETANGLTNDNFTIEGWFPQLVTDNDVRSAAKIVTFDCTLPLENISAEQWNGTPSISKDYEVARDRIVEKVDRLVESLSKD
ncbi:MAG: hypothetical protein ABJP45_02275 [Cyclobacteriaceae bacterium]